MSLTLWFFAVGAGIILFALTGVVWCALIVATDSDSVPGFEPSSSAALCSPRASQRDRPVDPRLPARYADPGRLSSRPASGPVLSGRGNQERDRILDDGIERHAWDWRERERELRGDA